MCDSSMAMYNSDEQSTACRETVDACFRWPNATPDSSKINFTQCSDFQSHTPPVKRRRSNESTEMNNNVNALYIDLVEDTQCSSIEGKKSRGDKSSSEKHTVAQNEQIPRNYSDISNNCREIISDDSNLEVKKQILSPEVIVIDDESSSKDLEEKTSPYGPSNFRLIISLCKDECDVITPNAEWMYKDQNGLELAFNRNTSLLFEHLYNMSSKVNSIVKMKLPETKRRYMISMKEMLMTDIENGEKVMLFRRTWLPDMIQPLGCTFGDFPTLWSPQENDIDLVKLDLSTAEYISIKDLFQLTMRRIHIDSIQRVQNKKLFVRYAFQKALLMDKNSGNEQRLNEKLLFHGTSVTPPRKIWESEDGFDLRYSRRGMWGIATYFAEDAAYSHNFAYMCKKDCERSGRKQMFVANVLTGNALEMEANTKTEKLTRPPVCVEATTTNSEELYDSVTGFTKGSRVYAVYKLDMAYPSYLVTYTNY